MKTATLKALIWKDFRLCRSAIIIDTFALAFPYLFFVSFAIWGDVDLSLMRPRSIVAEGALMSIWLSYLLMATLTINVTTAEFVDRSAGFLGYLPPSNAEILTSKSIYLLVPCVLWPGISIAMLKFVGDVPPQYSPLTEVIVPNVMTFIALAVLVFGTTWLLGLMMRNSDRRVFCAIITPMAIVWFAIKMHGNPNWEIIQQWLSPVAVSVGLICYAAGWVYGLRWGRAGA